MQAENQIYLTLQTSSLMYTSRSDTPSPTQNDEKFKSSVNRGEKLALL